MSPVNMCLAGNEGSKSRHERIRIGEVRVASLTAVERREAVAGGTVVAKALLQLRLGAGFHLQAAMSIGSLSGGSASRVPNVPLMTVDEFSVMV